MNIKPTLSNHLLHFVTETVKAVKTFTQGGTSLDTGRKSTGPQSCNQSTSLQSNRASIRPQQGARATMTPVLGGAKKKVDRSAAPVASFGPTWEPQLPCASRKLGEWRKKIQLRGTFPETAAAVQQNTKTQQILIFAALSLPPPTNPK